MMTAQVLTARMPWHMPLCVCFHHRARRLNLGRQAEPIEGRRHFSFKFNIDRDNSLSVFLAFFLFPSLSFFLSLYGSS